MIVFRSRRISLGRSSRLTANVGVCGMGHGPITLRRKAVSTAVCGVVMAHASVTARQLYEQFPERPSRRSHLMPQADVRVMGSDSCMRCRNIYHAHMQATVWREACAKRRQLNDPMYETFDFELALHKTPRSVVEIPDSVWQAF